MTWGGGGGGCWCGEGVLSCTSATFEGLQTTTDKQMAMFRWTTQTGTRFLCRSFSAWNYNKENSRVSFVKFTASTGSREPLYSFCVRLSTATSGLGVVAAFWGVAAVRFLNVAWILDAAFRSSGSFRSISAMSCSSVLWLLSSGLVQPSVCEPQSATLTAHQTTLKPVDVFVFVSWHDETAFILEQP